jgi:hypothetical protein
MDINITALIQIVNFSIAYVIIRNLLLKPAVSVILQEEEHQAQLDKTFRTLQAKNKSKEETIAREWGACQQEFHKHAPAVLEAGATVQQDVATIQEVPPLDRKAIEPMTDNVTRDLTERLSHVR